MFTVFYPSKFCAQLPLRAEIPNKFYFSILAGYKVLLKPRFFIYFDSILYYKPGRGCVGMDWSSEFEAAGQAGEGIRYCGKGAGSVRP